MSSHLLPKQTLNSTIESLISKYQVIAPVKKDDITAFEQISRPEEIDWGYTNTPYPPAKKYLFPHKEDLLIYRNQSAKPSLNKQKRVLLAIRPCDVAAVNVMDTFFLADPPDPHYRKRRQNTHIIALSCTTPCNDKCFCESLGTDTTTKGFDLLLTPIKEGYHVEAGTDWGKKALQELTIKSNIKKPNIKLHCQTKLPEKNIKKLAGNFKAEIWEEQAKECLSCTACTITCPTCGCFGLRDIIGMDLESGTRVREWQTCQLQLFTKVAGGHVFRDEREKRLKHRIYHKFDYFKEKFSTYMCIGCGRCISNCPSGIDMTHIMERI